MSFLIYDISFLVLFSVFVAIFLYKRKQRLQREGPLFLYRTRVGLKFIEYIGKRFKNQLRWIQYISIVTGYILMTVMLLLLGQLVYLYFKFPEIVKAIKIPPIMPLIPYLPRLFNIEFLPPFYFTYWIIILAIVAIAHEFSHGIFARFHKIKIKSTGFGFLGPFLAAFVEPDEKQLKRKSKISQISVLSAGSFANLVVCILFIILLGGFFNISHVEAGSIFNTYTFSIINISSITMIGDKVVSNPDVDIILRNLNQDNKFTKIKVDEKSYLIDNAALFSKLESINQTEEEINSIIAYDDLPAINANLQGVIIEFNGVKIRNNDDLKSELVKYKPGDSVEIKTKLDGEIKRYNIILAEAPDNTGRAYIGIGIIHPSRSGIIGKFYSVFSLFKDPATHYEQKFGGELIIFIYNLLWWIILINISVALVNMLPLGIFDGGRVFYLTVLAILKSEKKAKKFFIAITYFLLFLFLALMASWFYSIFYR